MSVFIKIFSGGDDNREIAVPNRPQTRLRKKAKAVESMY
jgi:hypothetical protein